MTNTIDKRIKALRIANNLTQAELARKLNITRASVNAWEMGISNPSTDLVVALAKIFKVSTDYLLGVPAAPSIDIKGLNVADVDIVYNLINRLRKQTD